jgi:DNA polymerase-1
MKHRILLVDTEAVLHSAKFSMVKQKLSHKELPTFVIYGFLMKLQYVCRKTHCNLVVFALDSKQSKRKKIYSKYKEKRSKDKTEEQIELDKIAYPQFDAVKNYVIPTIGYRNVFKVRGLEADDIIASICKTYKDSEIIIATTDQDLYQLLTDRVCIFNIRTNQYFTIDDFREKYGIEPKMWKRIKVYGGCSSDSVPGVPIPQPDKNKKQRHIAEKGALNYVLGKTKPTAQAYKAINSPEGKKVIARNKKLVILPFRGTPKFKLRPDRITKNGLKEVAEEYGMNSILDDLDDWYYSLKH